MTFTVDNAPGLAGLLSCQDGVLRVSSALDFMTRDALRWQVSSGRWQRCRGIVVTHSGPLTDEQRLWTTLLATGREAVLADRGAQAVLAAGVQQRLVRVLRFPAWVVRYHPGHVAAKIREALHITI